MSSILNIDGNEYHPATLAAKQFGYTKEYLLMLAKQGKIDGRKIANKWYVQISSVEKYFDVAKGTQEERRRAISEARKRELKEKTAHRTHDHVRERRIHHRVTAVAETVAVLVVGLMVGATGYLSTEVKEQQASLASAADFVDAIALSLYRAVFPEPVPAQVLVMQTDSVETHVTNVDALWTGSLVHSPVQAVQESFSDTVSVSFDELNPSVAVVTPVFESGEGETYRFLLTPVESVSESEDTP